jgi:hypothetical protein
VLDLSKIEAGKLALEPGAGGRAGPGGRNVVAMLPSAAGRQLQLRAQAEVQVPAAAG